MVKKSKNLKDNNLKPWMLILAVVITAILVGGSIFYGQYKLVQEKDEKLLKSEKRIGNLVSEIENLESVAQEAINKLNAIQDKDVKENIDYVNEDYGFSLILPVTWGDYQTKKRKLNFGENGQMDSIDFYFSDDLPIFNIGFIEKDSWNIIQNLSYYPAQKIGENSKYVFAYKVDKDIDSELLLNLADDLKNIIESIKIVDLVDQAQPDVDQAELDDQGISDSSDSSVKQEDDLNSKTDVVPGSEENDVLKGKEESLK